MNLKSNLWYIKWFFWSCQVLDYFTKSQNDRAWNGTREEKFKRKGANLCQLIRTLFWGTSLYTLQFVVYGLLAYVFVVRPFMLFSAASVLTVVGIVSGGVIGVLAVIAAIVWSIAALSEKMAERKANKPPKVETDTPSFSSVFWDYLVAQKQKICPMITFVGDDIDQTKANYEAYQNRFNIDYTTTYTAANNSNPYFVTEPKDTNTEVDTDGDKNEPV